MQTDEEYEPQYVRVGNTYFNGPIRDVSGVVTGGVTGGHISGAQVVSTMPVGP